MVVSHEPHTKYCRKFITIRRSLMFMVQSPACAFPLQKPRDGRPGCKVRQVREMAAGGQGAAQRADIAFAPAAAAVPDATFGAQVGFADISFPESGPQRFA